MLPPQRTQPASARASGAMMSFAFVAVLLVGLPIAVWADLTQLTEANLQRQSSDLNSLISSVRSYYASNVVGRVLANHGAETKVTPDYESVPGGIPIPATLSLELGRVIAEQQNNIVYRFVSDLPFRKRAPHQLDAFETDSLAALRENPNQTLSASRPGPFVANVRFVAPVLMGAACVDCHNSHPDSPKKDWKVGDVRGIQEIIVSQPIASGVLSFKFLLIYFILMTATGISFIVMQAQQARLIGGINADLEAANEFLAGLSMKISRYLSPQVYKSIFSGKKDVAISTERKLLTIFFSDIKDFTATTERLQPEVITRLLNEYFTDMSRIALEHGGTVDKFVGDAMLIFFGDPETRGAPQDARACMRMAFTMQRKIAELNAAWRSHGVENPFRVRMGINTGFCNVGNFGSADRMDYTIIGAEANLAARLQTLAEPGQIMISYETFVLVRDQVVAHALPPLRMKGISGDVIPYAIEALIDATGKRTEVFSAHMTGMDLYFDPDMVNPEETTRIRSILSGALRALEPRPAAE